MSKAETKSTTNALKAKAAATRTVMPSDQLEGALEAIGCRLDALAKLCQKLATDGEIAGYDTDETGAWWHAHHAVIRERDAVEELEMLVSREETGGGAS